jgi:hypothetical protein
VVDAVSYLLAAAALLVIRRDLQTKATAPPEPLWRATLTGLRWLWRHPVVGGHAHRLPRRRLPARRRRPIGCVCAPTALMLAAAIAATVNPAVRRAPPLTAGVTPAAGKR